MTVNCIFATLKLAVGPATEGAKPSDISHTDFKSLSSGALTRTDFDP